METGCDPSLLLNRQSRFRHVCPLLKQNAAGQWLCSVDTPDVRPFWTRAFALYGGALVLAFIIATSGAWSLLRLRGYPVTYYDVAWPGAWSRFHLLQSRYFAAKASRALEHHDTGEAVMALSIAYQLDPGNYPLGLLFARLTQVSQPGLSEEVYRQLALNHPDHAVETFGAWYEALLWRADFPSITVLAREALVRDPAHRAAWINALLFALHRQPDDKLLQALATEAPGEARAVFALELQTAGGGLAARDALLQAAEQNHAAGSILPYYCVRRLIEIGFGGQALTRLQSVASPLPQRDQLTLRLEASEQLGRRAAVRELFTALAGDAANPVTSELLCSYLIRHPDPSLFRSTFDAYRLAPAERPDQAFKAWAGWLCAAGANGDFVRYADALAEMKRLSGSELRGLASFGAFFRGEGATNRIESYVPMVQPLPLDVTYALLERYYLPRSTESQPALQP